MKLPGFFKQLFKKKENEVEYFLSLLFTETELKAAIWQKKEKEGEIINTGQIEISNDWEDDWEENIQKADQLIVEVARDLPQEKIKKVIFGLPSSFTAGDKICEPHLSNLKKLASDLSLTPIGFIANDEAIINYLSKTEGAPATVILLGFKKATFSLTICKVGKIEGIKERQLKEGLALCEEIAKILKEEFGNIEVLPSKILLYNDTKDLEEIRQELLSYPWLSKAEFLHFPKIEILENNFNLKALVFSAAMEMGMKMTVEEKKEKSASAEASAESEEEEEKKIEERIKEPVEGTKEIVEEKIDNFGFIKDRDIVEEIPPAMPDLSKIEEEKSITRPEESAQEESYFEQEKNQPVKKGIFPLNLKLLKVDLSFLANFKKLSILIVIVLFLLMSGLVLAYWYLPKAKVVIYISPKPLEREEEITIDPVINTLSLEKKRIPGEKIEIEEKGSKKIKTTGKKTIGEKAKGEVTIFNKTNYSKIFKAGTILYGPNELKFNLNEETTVASQSTSTSKDESTILTPGKAKVKVTAMQIGGESNLATGTEFRIEDLPVESYKGKNETAAFTSGSSREVAVVSADDQKNLLSLLTKELSEEAKKTLQQKVTADKKIIEKSESEVIVKKEFDKEIDQEGREVNLTLTLKIKALVYNNDDLENVVNQIISKAIPEGYEYKKGEVEKAIKESKIQKDDSVLLKMTFLTNLFPKVDTEQLKKDLSGKNIKDARSYLDKIPNLVDFKVNVRPEFPGFLNTFPKISRNIQIDIKKK